jgi:2-haloacid dehalogenase/putative hydrolase of the HAD superfamily
MIKALFIDFYGTIVHEDGAVIKIISNRIFQTGKTDKISDIGIYWWNEFNHLCSISYGEKFRLQRELEYMSLERTLDHFESTEDANELSQLMFDHWQAPPIFEDSKAFLEKCPIPICIVSNIDTADIIEAFHFHDIKPNLLITSEKARSYKPRKEIFELALRMMGVHPHEALHIGDSINSDVNGARSMGINPVWINRNHKEIPEGIENSISTLTEILDRNYFS